MSGRVRVLDDALVDQIAAGEVVERPASVVKELLDNALDAGARNVTVEVEGGGLERIVVADDGHGMDPEDAARSVARHATSKIARAEDLAGIRTLGFRGEALPSIASVSRFRLTTRPADAVGGTQVAIEGGGAPEVTPTGAAPGTTVEVRHLFYNVPARRKFLKTPATEVGHVADVCLRAALTRPGLRLRLMKDGRPAREYLPAGDLGGRAAEVFRHETLSPLEGERDGVRVVAHLAPPERARSGATALHVLVNGRPVRDRVLARAVAFAYGSVLPPGRYPIGVVALEVDPAEVDVNVHPQKAEVRFARGRVVPDAVTRVLAASLGTAAWGRPAKAALASGKAAAPVGSGEGPATELVPGPAPGRPGSQRALALGGPVAVGGVRDEDDPWGLAAFFGRRAPEEAAAETARDPASGDPALPAHAVPSGPGEESARGFGHLRFLAQVRRTFLLCEGPEGLHVLDQHAADERVRYHALRTAHAARKIPQQTLLFPEQVEVTEGEAAVAEEHADALAALGMDVASLGPTTLAVRAVPALVRKAPPERLLRDVLAELDRSGERAFGDTIDTAIATLACHGAIRAGDALAPEEAQALLAQLDRIPDFAGHCPHGRPVVFTIAFGELERRVGR